MPQVRGSDAIIALYDETAYGATPGTPDGTRVYYSRFTPTVTRNQIENPIIQGGRGKRRPGRGNWDVSLDVQTTLAPGNLALWLKHALGVPTGAGTHASPSVYVPKTLPVGFQLEVDWRAGVANKVERFSGCRVNKLDFTLNQEGFLDLAVSILGKGHAIASTPLDATLTNPTHVAFEGYQGIVKIGGTQVAGWTRGSISVENNLETGNYSFPGPGETAGERFSAPEDVASISGSAELFFQDFTLIELARAGTETTIEWVYTDTAGNQLNLLVDHVDIPPTSVAIETPKGLKLPITFTGFASGADVGLKITYTPAA